MRKITGNTLISPSQRSSPLLRLHFQSKQPPTHEHSAEEGVRLSVQYITENQPLIFSPNREGNRGWIICLSFVLFYFFTRRLLQPVWVSWPQQVKTWAGLQSLRRSQSREEWQLIPRAWPSGLKLAFAQPLSQGNPRKPSRDSRVRHLIRNISV